jgi:hypothetical protein
VRALPVLALFSRRHSPLWLLSVAEQLCLSVLVDCWGPLLMLMLMSAE